MMRANFAYTKYLVMPKTSKMIDTLAHGYSSENTQLELSNEYQHGRVLMVLKNLCILVLWSKVASSALERIKPYCKSLKYGVNII